MKINKFLLFTVIILGFTFISCDNDINKTGISGSVISTIAPYLVDDYDALIMFSTKDSYLANYNDNESFYYGNYSACFSDKIDFVNITSLNANLISVPRRNNAPDGYYGYYFSNYSDHPTNDQIIWDIQGFEGSSGTYTQSIAPRLKIDLAVKTDSVSKAAGFTFAYTGNMPTEKVIVHITIDNFINEAEQIDISNDPAIDGLFLEYDDLGSISIPTNKLNELISDRYYSVKLSHTKITPATIDTKSIAFVSVSDTETYFYLTD